MNNADCRRDLRDFQIGSCAMTTTLLVKDILLGPFQDWVEKLEVVMKMNFFEILPQAPVVLMHQCSDLRIQKTMEFCEKSALILRTEISWFQKVHFDQS